jgi:hypothetical protein
VNITELESTLDITFHDSLLRAMSTDFVRKTAVFILDVWVGHMAAPPGPERERRRVGRLELHDLQYLMVDPPDPRYDYRIQAPVDIDVCDADPEVASRYPIVEGVFAARFFVSNWNSFIHFAARSADLTWLDAE